MKGTVLANGTSKRAGSASPHCCLRSRSLRAVLAGLMLLAGTTLICAQGVTPAPAPSDCEQDNVASLAVRACTYLLSLLDLSPEDRLRILNRRGQAWLVEDDPEAAAEDFTKALSLEPGNVNALKGRVESYDRLGKFDLAVQDWTTLIALSPSDDKLLRNRGASYRGAKNYSLALADYAKSLQINPKGLDAYIGRALVYDAMGERDKALKEFEAGIAVDDKYLLLFWERARMVDRWGEKQQAINDYIAVLKINGHWANARKHLERLGVYSPY